MAFIDRQSRYKRDYVQSLAKHRGTQEETDAIGILRRVKTTTGTLPKLPVLSNAYSEKDKILSTHNLKETWDSRTRKSVIESTDLANPVRNQIAAQNIVTELYRDVQGHELYKLLKQHRDTGVPINIIDYDSGLPKSVTVNDSIIRTVPIVADALHKARELEEAAYESTTGYIPDPASKQSHFRELQLSNDTRNMNLSPDVGEDLRRKDKTIGKKRNDQTFKKYLKYKNKYLALKKQLGL